MNYEETPWAPEGDDTRNTEALRHLYNQLFEESAPEYMGHGDLYATCLERVKASVREFVQGLIDDGLANPASVHVKLALAATQPEADELQVCCAIAQLWRLAARSMEATGRILFAAPETDPKP